MRIVELGLQPYAPIRAAMQTFTAQRGPQTPDELWVVEHPALFTMGLAAKAEHLLAPGDIPVLHTERGGQVTYHGPGQVLVYCLIDLSRRHLGVKHLVNRIEAALIDTLAHYGVAGHRQPGAPGIYVHLPIGSAAVQPEAKIAALGLKVSRGCSYHGCALNVAMDLEPFQRINPCGYPGMPVTDLAHCATEPPSVSAAGQQLAQNLVRRLIEPPASIAVS